ncbi:tRNA (adenosine(37)-N6)-threonylcarbamoyltransferase complex dimerization subunit type 1 TsaB [Aridibaculum aurantiacum]|uniref:tRNA (adenosine(37)-N6)-threonylcarbamoyltransferase complex dimerization subunit type 1 TsaB n=1 Tax=Aridibaculum aurantiacum TaxID=2810307 RepID=UPI001A95F1F5|nr:tRNA (adenosine(37)-N6)-threonylcarbamoyltransferase complex dimerization subunit type 1 TsaB [Aridibaculum aurantiacum]
MPLILNIDTATDVASVCISKDGETLSLLDSHNQKEHASFIHVAIQKIMADAGYSMNHLDAVSVTIGPGSYTGLRVGLATAKGICYALQKPLITESTLKVMAVAGTNHILQNDLQVEHLCPMIDARRMEVFTAVYDMELKEILQPQALVLEPHFFEEYMKKSMLMFFGNGCSKYSTEVHNANAVFEEVQHNASHLATLAEQAFKEKKFADLAYSEPAYLKEFYTPAKSSKY